MLEHVKMEEDITPCVEQLTHVLTNILLDSPVIIQINEKKEDTELVQRVLSALTKLPNVEKRY